MKMSTSQPTQKVAAGGIAGAVSFVLIFIINNYIIGPDGPQITGEVATALTTIITFIVSYLTPPSSRDTIVTSLDT